MSYVYQDYETENVPGIGRVYLTPKGPYPSITTVLGHTAEVEKSAILNAWRARIGNKEADRISNAAANRGTNVHLMIERLLKGEDPKTTEFPPEHTALFKSLRLELKKINKVYGQEVVLYSDTMEVAGRCDLVGEYNGEIAIVDYKTSTRAKTAYEIGDYFVQVGFYCLAHNEMHGTDIKKLVIIMGVENKLPMIFKKTIDDDLILKVINRTTGFYAKL